MTAHPSLIRTFDGRVVFLTGAASGIGRELSRLLIQSGAILLAADHSAEGLAALRAELGEKCHPYVLDVVDPVSYHRVIEAIEQAHGRIDFLFNNAGVSILGEAHKVPFSRWKWLLDVNVLGVANGIAEVYPRMVRWGAGHIVNTASIAGSTGYVTAAAYTCSKGAVIELSRSLREEARAYGIKVSLVCPGYVKTNIFTQDRVIGAKLNTVMDDVPVKMMSPALAAASILKGVARRRDLIIFPLSAKILWLISRWAPSLLGPLQSGLLKAFREK